MQTKEPQNRCPTPVAAWGGFDSHALPPWVHDSFSTPISLQHHRSAERRRVMAGGVEEPEPFTSRVTDWMADW